MLLNTHKIFSFSKRKEELILKQLLQGDYLSSLKAFINNRILSYGWVKKLMFQIIEILVPVSPYLLKYLLFNCDWYLYKLTAIVTFVECFVDSCERKSYLLIPFLLKNEIEDFFVPSYVNLVVLTDVWSFISENPNMD